MTCIYNTNLTLKSIIDDLKVSCMSKLITVDFLATISYMTVIPLQEKANEIQHDLTFKVTDDLEQKVISQN